MGMKSKVMKDLACQTYLENVRSIFLLKNSDNLLSSGFLESVDNPLAVVPIATTFQAFNKLVQSCFGSDNVENDVLNLLDDFISANTATEHF